MAHLAAAAVTTASPPGDEKPPPPPFTIAPALQSTLYSAPVRTYLAANPTVTNPVASAAVFFDDHHGYHRPSPPPPTNDDDDENNINNNITHNNKEGEKEKGESRLLLLQRAPADTLPLKWELPGGSVDVDEDGDGDASLVHGAVRELGEETGLVGGRVVREVGVQREFYEEVVVGEGDGDRDGKAQGGRESRRTLTWRIVVFEIDVCGDGDGDVLLVGQDDDDDGSDGEGCGEKGHGVKGFPLVKVAPGEHVRYLWCTEDEVRAGRCGDVELDLTDPAWTGIMLRAFELHRSGGA